MSKSTTIKLEGRKVEVYYNISRAEPDVGIMSDYVEEWWTDKDVTLTEAEEAEVVRHFETAEF